MKSLFTFITSLILITTLSAKEPFIWADDEDYKPFVYRDKNSSVSGAFKDIMVEIFKRMDIPLKYDVYAWKRAQKLVKSANADGIITVPTKARLEFLKKSDPLIVAQERIFAREDNPRIKKIMAIKTIEELREYRVVDYIGSGWAKEHFEGLDIIWAPRHTNALLMMANKRADIYVISEFIGMDTIHKLIKNNSNYTHNLKKIVASKISLDSIDFTLLIRKNSSYAHIIPKFNATLKEMKEDGSYDKIIQKYLKAI